jgi:hypothetical protein
MAGEEKGPEKGRCRRKEEAGAKKGPEKRRGEMPN